MYRSRHYYTALHHGLLYRGLFARVLCRVPQGYKKVQKLQTFNPKPETLNPEPLTRNRTLNPKPGLTWPLEFSEVSGLNLRGAARVDGGLALGL